MSLINFICPDGGKINISDCLKEGGCRMGERCATRPYLLMASSERPHRFRCKNGHEIKLPASNKILIHKCKECGEPMEYVSSTTQLIQGTKAAFLKLTEDFDISPDSRAFMITGTKGHEKLETYDDECSFLEEKFIDEDITGIADLLTIEDGVTILSDYKVSGSYKVAKALGWVAVNEPTGEFYKSGKRKGEEKTRKVIKRSPESIDRRNWELQLNKYRINFEKQGFNVDKLKIQCVVRDGNTYIARQRGVFRNIYYFEINRIPDDEVNSYFDTKKSALLQALKQGYWNDVCTKDECWDGLKCAKYCEVADFCPQGKYLKQEKIKEGVEMPIQGLSETRRLPRMGKLRLGIMKETTKGVKYPSEVKHFILDPSVANPEEKQKLIDVFHKKYGDEPTSIDIMFPIADLEHVFPQYYKSYGKTTMLNCKGDGIEATTNNPDYVARLGSLGEGEFGTRVKCAGRECPYFMENKCAAVATLSVLLPEMPGAGVWQVTTGSYHSIINLNSCFDYIRALAGRYHMIPLKLERREQAIQHDGKKTNHYVLHINLELSIADLQRRALIDPVKSAMELPPPEDEKIDLYIEKNEAINPKEDVETEKSKEELEWDREPTDDQASLEFAIDKALAGSTTIEQLNEVVKTYKPQMKKDSEALTGLQKDKIKANYDKCLAALKESK